MRRSKVGQNAPIFGKGATYHTIDLQTARMILQQPDLKGCSEQAAKDLKKVFVDKPELADKPEPLEKASR